MNVERASPLVPAEAEDLWRELAQLVEVELRDTLEAAGEGQRLRVSTLPEPVMERVCAGLQDDDRWVAKVLTESTDGSPTQATATKLIEWRNALAEPLLVFLPPGKKTAAEDSLDIATFTELPFDRLSKRLVSELLTRLPQGLRDSVKDAIAYLRQIERWIRNDDEVVDYLLAVHRNGANRRAAGGALFRLGLVPHFGAFRDPHHRLQLSSNLKACRDLSDLARPLQERVARLGLVPETIQGSLFAFLRQRASDDVRSWTRDLATQAEWLHLTFDQWPFADRADPEDLRLIMEPLALPMQQADEVSGALQVPVLDLNQQRHQGLKISFRSLPKPAEVPQWTHFRIQLFSLDSEEPSLAWESNSYKTTAGRTQKRTRKIKVGDLDHLEDGTYFAKIEAYDQAGTLLSRSRPLDPDDSESRYENETEEFLIVRSEVLIEPPDPRAKHVPSLLDAWVDLSARAQAARDRGATLPVRGNLTGAWREPIDAAVRGDVHFRLEGRGVAGYTVLVPSLLRRLELESLRSPGILGALSVDLSPSRLEDFRPSRRPDLELGTAPETRRFLEARERVFDAILNQHLARSAGSENDQATRAGIVATADLLALTTEVETYAETFRDCAATAEPGLCRVLGQIDLVELTWRPRTVPSDPRRAFLAAPTHPLRLLWHLEHAECCQEALRAWSEGTAAVPSWKDFLNELRRDLLPVNLPPALFDARGTALIEQGPLTPHWALYLPDRTFGDQAVDSAATRGLVRRRLGVRAQAADPGRVAALEVAKRLFDYVQQHPYVEQLKLAVFNPGNAELIADTLRLLEKQLKKAGRGTPPLRYAVQLFSADDHPEHLGSGLEALLDPDRQVGEDDEFTLRSSNPLLPKLVFARSTVKAYLKSPETFTAHVSLLIEQSALRGRVASMETVRRGSFVRGLVQEPETTFDEHGASYSWRKALRAATSERPRARECLLAELVAWSQRVHVSAATGEPAAANVAPVVEIHLEGEGRVLLDEVHRASDWVLTLDRHLGLEYFDQPAVAGQDAYLLDFAPEYLQEDRQRLMLTTRSTEELASLLRPALDSHSLKLARGEEPVVLEALRSLSGRLALRLLAAPGRSSEIIGLLLARWLLEQAGRLFERIIVPLDAHQSWFQSDDLENVSRRADLLLVGFDPERALLRFSVVEVKLRESVTPGGSLYVEMRDQAEATVERLRRHFDPELYADPRADALLRAKKMTTLLTFYVHRAQRYGLFERRAAQVVLDFLQHLDSGYRLEVDMLGVIFEQNAETSTLEEEEPGFPVFRFGHAAAQGLLDDACARNRTQDREVKEASVEPSTGQFGSLAMDPLIGSFRDRVGGHDKLTTTGGPLSQPSVKPKWVAPKTPEASERYPTRQELDKERPPEASEVAEVPAGAEPEAGESARVPDEKRPYQSTSVPPSEITDVPVPDPDILIGANEMTPQWGILGKSGSSQVALDLTGCNTISLFGVQGFGKSYTLGVIAEMAAMAARGLNRLPSPLATVIFHYHDSDAYPPEYVSAVAPNRKEREVRLLQENYGAEPQGLKDVVILTPEAKVEERRHEFPGLDVRPIKFASAELGKKWRFLLGAYGSDALYIRQMMAIMRRYREDLTLEDLRREIADTELPKNTRRLAEDRIKLAEPYIDDNQRLSEILRPGRTVIVDLRDEWIEKEEALGLFVVMLEIFAKSQFDGQDFNKLVVFDEAHKYITESDLIAQVVRIIREMRHQRTSVVIASQDPLSVPRSVIELSTVLMLHRMTSPQWLRHLKSGIAALDDVTEKHLSVLRAGEALIWAQRCTDVVLTQRPRKIQIRPRFAQHGGGTKTAVSGVTIR